MKQFFYPYILLRDSMEAAKYYERVFDGKIIYIMKGKDTPNCPEDRLEEIMHLQLKFQNNEIFMADHKGTVTDSIQLHLDYEDKEQMIAAFNRFKEESKVIQELGETFWGAYFGVVEDKYGVVWQFHYMLEEN